MTGFVENFSKRLKGALRRLMGDSLERCPAAIEADGLRAVCLAAFPEDDKTLDAWNRLADAAPFSTTFHRPAWQRAAFLKLCRADRFRLVAVWRGDSLVAIAPMSIREDGLLESLGPSVSDYLDPLVHPEFEPAAWNAMLRIFAAMRSARHPAITLHNIRDAAPCRKILPGLAAAEGFDFAERACDPTPVLALPGTWEEYLATFDAHERKETRRKINKAMTKGGGRLVRCGADPAEIAPVLATALRLMEQAEGDKGRDVQRTLHPFLEIAAPPLIASGHLVLTTLLIEEQPAAVTLQFPHSTGPQLYNCGFDPSKREWSPGVVLTALSIQQAIESGAAEYDLLRGREPYKYKLGAKDRPLWMLTLRRR